MSRLVRRAWTFFALTAALGVPSPARAWVEQAVKSDSVTVDLERDGHAVVTHEILLWVRGGPLSTVSVEPVDDDADLVEGATATIAQSGHAAGYPLPLEGSKDGARLTFTVVGAKGLRTGTHLIRFAYRTRLGSPAHVHATALGTAFEWNGPSFADGIDSEKVVFRLPSAPTPPRVGPSDGHGDAENVADDRGGVFLATFRRAGDKDELEIVRPHVAKNEIVPWQIHVDPSVFDAGVQPSAPAPSPVTLTPSVVRAPASAPTLSPWWLAVTALAIAFGTIVALKSRWVSFGCREHRATPRPLLPIPTALRALLAGLSILGGAVLLVASLPDLAALTLVVALAAGTHLPPRIATPLRGPGNWNELDPDVAFADGEPARTPGRFVDSGTPLGFLLFASLLALFVAAAIFVMHRSEYYGLSVALASALLFPVFCTGRAGELPPDPVHAPADLLDWLMTELSKDGTLTATPIGRMPLGKSEPDEIRLRVLSKKPVNGFVGIEVGLDVHQGALGLLPLPFVLVRVSEGSPAADALPKGLYWTRGRSADEKVAVLRPKIATRRMTALLVADVAARLSVSQAKAGRQPGPTSSARSSGKAATASNAGTRTSPAHAT